MNNADWNLALGLIGMSLTIAAFIFKAGELKATFRAEINDLRNYIDRSGIAEGATNEQIKLRLNYLEEKLGLQVNSLSFSLEKETDDLKRNQNSFRSKIAQIENFLAKTTDYHRRPTEQ